MLAHGLRKHRSYPANLITKFLKFIFSFSTMSTVPQIVSPLVNPTVSFRKLMLIEPFEKTSSGSSNLSPVSGIKGTHCLHSRGSQSDAVALVKKDSFFIINTLI